MNKAYEHLGYAYTKVKYYALPISQFSECSRLAASVTFTQTSDELFVISAHKWLTFVGTLLYFVKNSGHIFKSAQILVVLKKNKDISDPVTDM